MILGREGRAAPGHARAWLRCGSARRAGAVVLVLVLIGTPSCGRKSEKVRQEDGEQKVRR
eukprot:COSAG02_NODE_2435_length_8869_cov_63.273774_7_plen_60_part_00